MSARVRRSDSVNLISNAAAWFLILNIFWSNTYYATLHDFRVTCDGAVAFIGVGDVAHRITIRKFV
jgi:hypothetical protein